MRTRISMSFAVAAVLAGCTPAGDDELEPCLEPGTELLPNVEPVVPAPSGGSMNTCTTGWGTDAPQLAPAWTKQIRDESLEFRAPTIMAHADGGVIVAAMGVLDHYGVDGEPLWSNVITGTVKMLMYLAVEDAGTILLGVDDYMVQGTSLTRYAPNGAFIGEIEIAWNSAAPHIWGVTTFGTDIVIAADDENEQGSYEATLIRLDADGNVMLRKSTNQLSGDSLAVTGSGVALFGSSPAYLLSLADGAVLGTLVPTNGNIWSAVGLDDGFIVVSNVANATADLGIGRYSSTGVEQWLQTYDRAMVGETADAVAVDDSGGIVVAGSTTMLDLTNSWFGTQPIVFGVDADGNARWTDRIGAHADASAVAIGVDGDVYVAGIAAADVDVSGEQPPISIWLRRYVP
jgi:type IV secretory pathway VirB2 component (pilin)